MISFRLIRAKITAVIILGLVLRFFMVNPNYAQAAQAVQTPQNTESIEVKACSPNPSQQLSLPEEEQKARLPVFIELLGTWKGRGYNLIPLPVNSFSHKDKTVFNAPDGKDIFRVKAQFYNDEITF